jgi:uncharacterized protein
MVIVVVLQNISAMALFVSAIILISESKALDALYKSLAVIGRMSLTNYLIQSILGMLLYYHYGLGLYLKTTPAENFGIAIALVVAQVLFCRMWFQYFKYGPVEWLLRATTLLELPSIITRVDK